MTTLPSGLVPFQDRVALITGSARRIGRCIAEHLAQLGAHIIVHHRSLETASDAQATAQAIRKMGRQCIVVRADVTVSEQVRAMFKQVESAFGRLDLLVNNASCFEKTPWLSLDVDAMERSLAVNLNGPLLCVKLAEPLMSKDGSIVNIADYLSFEPNAEYSAHCVSKSALIMLTRCLALSLAPSIRVNAIAPGVVLLPSEGIDAQHFLDAQSRTSLQRIGRPDDIAQAVAYLWNADYITGTILQVDGGRSLSSPHRVV